MLESEIDQISSIFTISLLFYPQSPILIFAKLVINFLLNKLIKNAEKADAHFVLLNMFYIFLIVQLWVFFGCLSLTFSLHYTLLVICNIHDLQCSNAFGLVNPFLATGLFLYHVKTENLRFSNVFRGYRKRSVA